MLQWIQNNLGLLIVALSFGASGLGWLLQKLKQAQQAKRADQLRQRARLEALRTGRIESPQAQPAGPRPMTASERVAEATRRRQLEQQARIEAQKRDLEEQVRRRREAIEAQRQQSAQRAGQRPSPPRPPAPPPAQRPGQRQGQPTARPTPKPAPQRPAGERRRPQPIQNPATAQQAQAAILQSLLETERERVAPAPKGPAPAPGRPTPASILGSDLRQAIILREILDRPIALRSAQDSNW